MSWSLAVERLGRDDDFRGMVEDRFTNAFRNGVVLVAPTGNVARRLPESAMAFPASLDSVTAVGAATPGGMRARVSRYGAKQAGGSGWFMVCAPVDAAGEVEPLLRVGARTFSRTSIAAAVASGLIARCGLLDPSPPSWNDLERTEQAREQSSALLALADQGLVQDYDPAQHGNGILRYPDQAPAPDEG